MKRLFPYTLLTLAVLLIAFTNFLPHTYLIGWDNLQVELSPWINLKRAIFTAWQEYQGTGLAGGMGHAADVFRQLFLFLLYPIVPQNHIRFVWTMLTLLFGAWGMYLLLKTLFSYTHEHHLPQFVQRIPFLKHTASYTYTPVVIMLSSLVGALFYVLNLATLQSYYIPFEVFTAQFASLPWLLLATFLYLTKPSAKALFFLVIILLASTPTGYVPTVFVVYCMAAGILALTLRNPFSGLTLSFAYLRHIVSMFLIIFVVNAFWILPFAYFTITSSAINVNAKINQMSTENIFALNKEFGTIGDVILLKGFWFQSTEPTRNGTHQYLMGPWRDHLQNPFISGIGYFFFLIILIGIASVFLRKNKLLYSFVLLFLFTTTMLLTATPPFSWVGDILRNYVPLFGQVFRFPFTKFSLLAACVYALFFGLGFAFILASLKQFIEKEKEFIYTGTTAFIITVMLLGVFMWPAFTGNFFYKREQLAVPKDYFALFAFFKTQDPTTRIANFPQPAFWSWSYYDWEYSGSGFLWYGIKQPILDRAFDVWSNYSENYYFEVAHAVYSKNPQMLSDVFQKYQVTWVLVDKHVINPTSPKALFIPEFEELLAQLPSIKKEKTFGKLDVYKIALSPKPTSFVFMQKNLPTANAYIWSNNDIVYQTLGNYIAIDLPAGRQGQRQKNHNQQPNYIYPFHSLFSLKTEKEKTFTLTEQSQTVTMTTPLTISQDTVINIPSYLETETFLPITLHTETVGNTTLVYAVMQTPRVSIDKKQTWENIHSQILFTIPQKTLEENFGKLNINGTTNYTISNTTKTLGTTLLSLTQDNVITYTPFSGKQETEIVSAESVRQLPMLQAHSVLIPKGTHTLTIQIPKITDKSSSYKTEAPKALDRIAKCDVLRPGTITPSLYYEDAQDGVLIESTNATACLSLYTPNLSHRYGYAIFVKSKNITGRSLHFWVENIDQHYVPLDTYVTLSKTPVMNSFVLAPQDPYGNYYSLHLENISVGAESTKNVLFQIAMYPLPYNFITSLYLSNETEPIIASDGTPPLAVSHPNESLYDVTLPPLSDETLVLSQAYNPGWQAYLVPTTGFPWFHQALPFLVGKRLDSHVLVNNWQNGWHISGSNKNQRLIIVYLPQYLEYAGLIGLLAIVTLSYKKMALKTPEKRSA